MKTGLIFAVIFSIIRVVGACTATGSGQVYGNLTLYLDTGTGPNHEENRCRCRMSVSHTSTELVLQSIAGDYSFSHTIEVAGYVLNSTTTRLEVVLVSVQTDLWITTDGIGGVCVLVAIQPPDSEKRFGISCFTQQPTILTTTTSRSTVTSAVLQTKSTDTTISNPTSVSKLQIYVHGQDNENLIGPLVGGVSGLVVLVSITAIAIYCIRKRKHGNNPNVTRSYENKNMNISESPTPQQTYEYIQQPTYINQGAPSLSDNRAITYEGVTRHSLNEHIYFGISEDRTTSISKNHIETDD